MGLEEQLIKGAGEAIVKDPYGRVQRAKDIATGKITQGLMGVGKKLAEKKKEKEDELKGYDDNWEANQKQFIDDQGLGKTGWGQATDLAEELKATHDACAPGKEGNRCRQESIIDLKNMSQKFADQKASLQGYVDTQDKIKAGKIDLSEAQSPEAKKILAGLNDRNSSNRMKNDDEIASVREQLKTAKLEDREVLKKQLEDLKKTNERVVGWDIPDVGFMTAEDLDNANLLPVKATDVTTAYGTRVEDGNLSLNKLKKGAEGGKAFDMDESKHAHAKTITEDNIASVYADTVLETDQPLKEHLIDHPIFTDKYSGTRLTYDSLGLPESLDTDDDGSIDKEEFAALGDEDRATIINALSNPDDDNFNFKLSKDVAAGWMALNEEKEANKTLYGDEYYQKPDADGKFTYNGVKYDDIFTMQNEIKRDKTTLRNGGRENEADFLARGGIKGMMQSGTVLIKRKEGIVEQKLAAPGDTSIYNK